MGHYIVVLVYDSNDDTFLYLNPADGPRGGEFSKTLNCGG